MLAYNANWFDTDCTPERQRTDEVNFHRFEYCINILIEKFAGVGHVK